MVSGRARDAGWGPNSRTAEPHASPPPRPRCGGTVGRAHGGPAGGSTRMTDAETRGKQFPRGRGEGQGPSGRLCPAWLAGGRGAAPKASCPPPRTCRGRLNTNGANRDVHSAHVTTHSRSRALSLTPPEGACLARARLGSAASTGRAPAFDRDLGIRPPSDPPTLWDSVLGSVLSWSCRWPAGGGGGGPAPGTASLAPTPAAPVALGCQQRQLRGDSHSGCPPSPPAPSPGPPWLVSGGTGHGREGRTARGGL